MARRLTCLWWCGRRCGGEGVKERGDIDIQYTTQYGQQTPDGLSVGWLRQESKNILENTWNLKRAQLVQYYCSFKDAFSFTRLFLVMSSPTKIRSKTRPCWCTRRWHLGESRDVCVMLLVPQSH